MLELPSYPGYSSQVILVDGIGPRLKALQRLLGTRQSFKLNQCISLFNPHNNSMKEIYYYLHLTDEEAEVKKGYVTSPRSITSSILSTQAIFRLRRRPARSAASASGAKRPELHGRVLGEGAGEASGGAASGHQRQPGRRPG